MRLKIMTKGDEIETSSSSSKKITLKSIYEMIISIKQDLKNLDTKVTDLDTQLNKVIELNNLKV